MTQQGVLRTEDFELLPPDGWNLLESECEEDHLVLQSADEDARLTLSTRHYKGGLKKREVHDAFASFVEIRRSAEAETNPQTELSDCDINEGDGLWYTKWAGRDESKNRRSCTLATLENKKLYTLFVEAIGMTDDELLELAGEIFEGFTAK